MKTKWALFAMFALVAGTANTLLAQYTPFPAATTQTQFPQYSSTAFSPPPTAAPEASHTDRFATTLPGGTRAAPAPAPANSYRTIAPATSYGTGLRSNTYRASVPTNTYGTQLPSYGTSAPTNGYGSRMPVTSNISNSLRRGGDVVPQTFGHAAPQQPAQQFSPAQVAPGLGIGHDMPFQTHTEGAAHCAKCYTKRQRGSWYGGVSGVMMTRDNAHDIWLSYDQADIRDRVLNTNDAEFQYSGGFGFNLGRYFNCGRNSLEVSYWGVFSDVAEANALGANTVVGLDTILHFDSLDYDPGVGGPQPIGPTFFFNAERHRVQRDYEIHNIELNLLGHCYNVGCSPLTLGWTAGVRFLRFDESFLYSTDPVDTVFTGAPEELHYGVDVENNLIGFQIGGRGDYCLGNRLTLFAETKAGLYGNHISHQSQIFGSNGFAFVNDAASPYNLQDVNIDSSKDDVAVIGQLGVGANWCINQCWTIGVGYQAVGVSGVALATHQIPRDFIGALDSVRAVDSSGGLILHGGFLTLQYAR